VPVYIIAGKLYVQMQRDKEAEAALNEARRLDPQNTAPLEMLAVLYLRQQSVGQALKQYEQATKANPNDAGVWTVYGILNDQTGQTEAARGAYEKALALQPTIGIAANNLAWLYAEKGLDLDRALELARRAKIALPESMTVN